jgi:hypothetical protein
MVGGVAQGVGSEFKPQYQEKKFPKFSTLNYAFCLVIIISYYLNFFSLKREGKKQYPSVLSLNKEIVFILAGNLQIYSTCVPV